MTTYHRDLFSTYSIVARDAETGQLGVAVQTHQMCVGIHVPWLLPGVGAIATQAMVNVSFGPMGLAMLREGVAAPDVLHALVASDADADSRQVGIVDAAGRAAAWTGAHCIAEASHHVGEGYSVQANMMDQPTVVAAMADAYEKATGDLAARMLAALQAAQREGGDIRGMQSAALKVVGGAFAVPEKPGDIHSIYDLRVDEHADPLAELSRLVRLRRAQLLDEHAYEILEDGDQASALAMWEESRTLAPELEELPFWQAVELADTHADIPQAAAILGPVLIHETNRAHWIDLIRRIQACGIIKRPGAGEELITALAAFEQNNR